MLALEFSRFISSFQVCGVGFVREINRLAYDISLVAYLNSLISESGKVYEII